jgi:hypothetical protein
VGVSRDACFTLLDDGRMLRWADDPPRADILMQAVAGFAAGKPGWVAIDGSHQLRHGGPSMPQRVAGDLVAGCIGESADYCVRGDGTLWVKGLAHRGQYGDFRLAMSFEFISTAGNAVAVKAHTGHVVCLRRVGVVLRTAAIGTARFRRTAWTTRPTPGVRSSMARAPLLLDRGIRKRSGRTAACVPGARAAASNRACR